MQASKLQVKVYAAEHAGLTAETFIPVLHGWIKNHALPELMIDVANYGHVPKGPGVVLIGHACDYGIDEGEGRFGLLHSRKRMAPEPAERVADAFRRALHAASLLEADPAVKPELEALAGKLFAGAPFEIGRAGGAKDLFGVRIVSRAGAGVSVGTLLARLGGPPERDRSLPPG
jgi:hypothetical protein